MSLIATARALDDARFLWRVGAATITVAKDKLAQPEGAAKWFAEHVLDRPMEANPTMAALVATNTTISSAVIVDSFNTVNTEDVADSDIIYVVDSSWDTVAARWDELMHPTTTAPAAPTATA